MGLRSAAQHAAAAFISSSLDSKPLLNGLVPTQPSEHPLEEALANYSTILQLEEPLSEEQVDGEY